MNKVVDDINFVPTEVDKRPCSYNTNRFMVFYGDIIAKLWISLPFTYFQVDVLNTVDVCPSQLTWNAWVFVFYFEVICMHLKLKLSISSFFFFFTYT